MVNVYPRILNINVVWETILKDYTEGAEVTGCGSEFHSDVVKPVKAKKVWCKCWCEQN